ncbi:MAG: ATP-grasp domain-containing protein [Burkholderiales bacterium]
MMLLEHDAKMLLGQFGVPVPEGVLVADAADASSVRYPCFVKAQVPVGGRGKAGGIVRVESVAELREALGRLVGSRIRGHRVHECRLEQPARGQECYISLMLDAQSGEVIVLMSAQGGVDIEQHAGADTLLRDAATFDPRAVRRVATAMVAKLPAFARGALAEAAGKLTDAFFSLELTLAEINPLFVLHNGAWVAGDAKLVADDNAIERQPALMQLLRERAHAYPEASLKIDHGFDFVRLDEDGDVGMLTTGAGLSMQLVDELTRRGCRPFNFVDIRTGQFRGSPDRLIQVLRWIGEGRNVKVILMNFFAGVTDLAELSRLILVALERTSDIRIPIVIRLIGNGLEAARKTFADSGASLVVETDLGRAVDQVVAIVHAVPSVAGATARAGEQP